MTPIRSIRSLIAALACFALCALAHAQAWSPSKPIRFIIPQLAGGGADAIGRTIAQGLSDRVGQPVIVENRPGANGGVGADALLRSPADGYTVMLVFTSLMALNPVVYAKVPYDPIGDFVQIGSVCELPLVLVGNQSLDVANAAELVARAKAKPGQIFAGSSGNGAFTHLLLEMVNHHAGIKLVHVPFKGEAAAVQHLLTNQDAVVYFGTVGATLPHIQTGKMKPLAVSTARRVEQLPYVATLKEQGVGDFNESFWFGVASKTGTPLPAADAYQQHVAEVARTPAIIQSLAKFGCTPMQLSGAALGARIKLEMDKYGVIAKSVGMRVD
ncbi:MAG: Bug family tripartite tricarboxylate transporter substrate binding protein [Burkholderiales bacterium]